MTPTIILAIIISITVASFLFNQFLEFLNLRNQRKEIPAEMAGFYDKDKYLKSLEYNREHTLFSFFSASFSFFISLVMLVLGGFGWLDGLLRPSIQHPTMLALVFFGVVGMASDLISLPFQWYETFVLEEKYGFNKTTIKTFITDKIKSWLLGALIGGVLFWIFMIVVERLGEFFWIWFGLVISVFILFVNMFYTSLILPLFNKLSPLPDGNLKDSIQKFSMKVNFPLDNIFVIDGSKRSSKANAFFSGIGKKKKIVLYDTLVEKHTTEELVAVLAHEVGHFKKKHIIWGYILSIVQVFFTLWVLSLMLKSENLSFALGGSQQAIHLSLLAFGILFSPLSAVIGILMTLLSRKNEFEADAYARENYDGLALAVALKKLSVDTLSNLYPHPAYVFFHYSHPPLMERLKKLGS